MNATDLMIGDWLIPYGKTEPSKIESLGYQYDMAGRYDKLSFECEPFTFTYPSYCKPIPLTPEVLARMGFTIEEVPKYDDTYTEDEYTATIKCVDTRKCEVEIEYNTYWKNLRAFNYDPHNRLGFTSIETQVEYVHELQHILRVMKVDKEIVL